jgi:hypothetical protein
MATLDAQVVTFLEHKPDADCGIGRRLGLLLLGFLGTEVVSLADRLAGLGIDPSPLLARDQRHPAPVCRRPQRPTFPGDTPDHV